MPGCFLCGLVDLVTTEAYIMDVEIVGDRCRIKKLEERDKSIVG